MKRTISIILLVLITVGLLLPGVMAANDKVVITYGKQPTIIKITKILLIIISQLQVIFMKQE